MKLIFGLLFGIGCIFGGYVIAGGKMGPILIALPVKMMIIMGGALGAFVINNEPKVLKGALAGIGRAMKSSKYTKARYMELLALLYDILQKARKEGLMAIESDVENPQDSALFQKYPAIAADHHTVEFITDYLRMMVSGNLNAHEIESIMDSEIEAHHNEGHVVVAAYARLAGALPAFGIVAAVMGVIKTMGSVTEPFGHRAARGVGGQDRRSLAGCVFGDFSGLCDFRAAVWHLGAKAR